MKKDYKIVPIIIGSADIEMVKKIASALKPYFAAPNLFVISSDFSHYPAYNDAVIIDKLTEEAIISGKPESLIKTLGNNPKKGIANLSTSLCGWTSVLTLMYLTNKTSEYHYNSIEYKNSGDVNYYGDSNRVVGYWSIAITTKAKVEEAKDEFKISEEDKNQLLQIARTSIDKFLKNKEKYKIDTLGFSKNIKANCGAFVTLHLNGKLRGCIGRFVADKSLYLIVQEMAIAAATQDYRFSPVTYDELKTIDIEISVLSPLKKIASIDEIELGKHGIYIMKGSFGGTFLPQVAAETGWTKEEFLGHCAQDKAGIGWSGWKDADIFIYSATIIKEKE
jgi:AmmeMemoRadiSam system protein A